MSIRTWNTAYERRRWQGLVRTGQEMLELAYSLEYGSSDDESDDGNSSITSNSTVSTSESPMALVHPTMVTIIHYTNTLFNRIEDVSIVFGQSKRLDDFNNAQCFYLFRWQKEKLRQVIDTLWHRLEPFFDGDISSLLLCNRYRAPYETCFLVYLARLSYPRRLRPDLEAMFGMRKSHLSACVKTFSNALYQLSSQYLLHIEIWRDRMPLYAQKIADKLGNLVPNIWGFIDGTIRRIRRPVRYQSRCYTRYRRCHAIKFQTVTTPDGFIAHLAGPFLGRDHDARMLAESLLLHDLQELMPEDGSRGIVYCLYADLAYPLSAWIMKGFVNPAEGSPERMFNAALAKARVAVEWGYSTLLQQWQFLDFHRSAMILKMPMGQYYINAAFLSNLRNCMYGGEACMYFDCDPLTLDQYLGLVDH